MGIWITTRHIVLGQERGKNANVEAKAKTKAELEGEGEGEREKAQPWPRNVTTIGGLHHLHT